MSNKRWEKSDLSLYLKFISKKENEKVQAFALPVCKIGRNTIALKELSDKFKNKDIFIFGRNLSLSLLEELGVTSLGRFLDGEKIEPILLNTNEILYRGSKRLDYLYDGVIFNSKAWRIRPDIRDFVKFHMEFLQLYGMNGGIVSFIFNYLFMIMYECCKDDKNTLVLLKKSSLDDLLTLEENKEGFIEKNFCILRGLKNEVRYKNKVICTYTALEKHTELLEEKWDKIIYAYLSEVIKNNAIKKLSGNFKLAFFGTEWYKISENKLTEILNILDIDAERNLIQYIIRDVMEDKLRLPEPFEFKKKEIEPKELLVKLGNNKYYKINNQSNFKRFEVLLQSNFNISNFGKYDFTEFKSNYPSYKNMSNNQIRWYIYWREMAKNGHFIETDYGYILLYAYEIINGFNYDYPKDGIKKLFWLWIEYRDKFDNIDEALSSWLIDFAFINKLRDELYYLLDLMVLRDEVLFNVKLFMKYILNDCDFDDDSILDIIKLSKYNFGENNDYLFLFSEVNKVLNSINNKLKSQYGKNLFERFCPFTRKEKNMFVYFDAVYDGEDFYKLYYYSFTEHKPIIEFLSNIIKYVEDEVYNPQKLSIDKKYYNTALDNKNKRKEIKIDMNLLNSIRKETEEIQDILITEEIEEKEKLKKEKKEEKPKKEKKEEKSEINSIDKFILELKDYEKNTILIILNGENIEKNIKKIAQLNFLMPEIIIDSINEKFTQLNGDILIDTSEDSMVIVDEYKEEISNILKEIKENE